MTVQSLHVLAASPSGSCEPGNGCTLVQHSWWCRRCFVTPLHCGKQGGLWGWRHWGSFHRRCSVFWLRTIDRLITKSQSGGAAPRVVVSLETTNRDRVPGEEEGGWSISGRDSLCDDPCRASSLSLPTLPGHCQRADACTACTHAPGTEHGGEPGSPPSCLQGSPFLCLPPDANAESEENDSRSGNTETGKARDCRCHRHPSALHDPDDCCRPQVTVTEA